MRLPDFSDHVGLDQLRQQMRAELTPWRSGGDWEPIDIDGMLVTIGLVTTGIDIRLDEIEYASDGTLEYEGQKVVVYIRDQHIRYPYKFHVADCWALSEAKSQGRYDSRYVVTTRRDGRFTVNFLGGERGVERRLDVCRCCLDRLNYRGYSDEETQQAEQDEIMESFDLNEFFSLT